MNKLVLSAILLLATPSIFPMLQPALQRAPLVAKSLAARSGAKRNITDYYLPEIAQAAIVFMSINVVNAGILQGSRKNSARAQVNDLNYENLSASLDFNKETNKFGFRTKRITADNLAAYSAFLSIISTGLAGGMYGNECFFNDPHFYSSIMFCAGNTGAGILSLKGVYNLCHENEKLRELALKKMKKDEDIDFLNERDQRLKNLIKKAFEERKETQDRENLK